MILDGINSPSDLRALPEDRLEALCAEVREYMIDVCSRNPGHLASSLGAVEIIVGLHYVFDTPKDKIVFDVGHQAYAHKILTGRRDGFSRLRSSDGVSGFPRREESPYDAFSVGHSSTSISAALGLAEAARLKGDGGRVVAVIGDGALTGGLAFEGLNNAGASGADILVILNDNNQSIDPNHGALHNYLLHITTAGGYNRMKNRIWNFLGEGRLRDFLQRSIKSLKSWVVERSGGDVFEALGFRYFGPVDGNDINQVTGTLRRLKTVKGPRILHCITTKGKGYAPAEADPVVWHAPGKFDPATGLRQKVERPADRYQDVFGTVLCELADMDSRVVGVTPAMASGCGMTEFGGKYPDRFFDVGIEEEHAVTFSAGLTAGGMRVFCNIYSSFSQRAYDQIIHDVALQRLPVTLCFDRAGLVGEDGATHTGAYDLAAYRSIPGVVIGVPRDETALKNMMYSSLKYADGPYIIRYPRGCGEGTNWKNAPFEELPLGKAEEMKKGSDVAVVCLGPGVHRAMEAASSFGGKVGVYDFRFLKPLDEEMLGRIFRDYRAVLTIEDGCLKGGLFGAVAEYAALCGAGVAIDGIGISDEFVAHGRQSDQRALYGMDTAGIEKRLKKFLENSEK